MEFFREKISPVVMFEDNQACIRIAQNPVNHLRTKHLNVKYHFIYDAVHNSVIEIRFCPTEQMLADVLTKPLGKVRFQKLINLIMNN